MQEKLERIMRRIHVLLSNCKESAYSSEDLIVPKKRLFSLLEELNYAVYELMEQYEATAASRERAVAEQERKMAQIKEDAEKRAEDTYAASLLLARDMLVDMRSISEKLCHDIRREYEGVLKTFDDRTQFLYENEEETIGQLKLMGESRKYLRLIELQNKEKEEKKDLTEEEKKLRKERAEEEAEIAAAEAMSELSQKLSAPIVVQVNEQPKIPEGFERKRSGKKKKYAPNTALEETVVDGEGVVEPPLQEMQTPQPPVKLPDSDQLDREYFESLEEQKDEERKHAKGIKKLFGKR